MTTVNECLPITIFPLGIACKTTNPSGPTESDGSIVLVVTGGTPPYNVTWENGNSSFAIDHLSVGSYPVTVVDYYGDFTATTACVLSATTTTTSTSTTTTTLQPTYDFCMIVSYLKYVQKTIVSVNLFIHFNPNGLYNGYQSWISDDSMYTVVWDSINNYWVLVGIDVTVTNPNPAYPPLSGWQILGVIEGSVTVYEGPCQEPVNLTANVSTNPSTCSNCDGNITLEGIGGVPPYEYSIDGGVTWTTNPLFTSLCPNVHFYPKVKDSNGDIATPTSSDIYFPTQLTTTYNLAIATNVVTTSSGVGSQNVVSTTTFTVSPPLPIGVTVSFNAQNINEFIRRVAPNSYFNNTTYSFTKNGNPIAYNTQTTSDTNTPNGCGDFTLYNTVVQTNWNNVTISNGDILTLVITSNKTKNALVNCYSCCASSITNTLNFSNEQISQECACCILTTTVTTSNSNGGATFAPVLF